MKSSSRVALIAALVFSLFTPSMPVANAEENPFALLLGAQQLIGSFNELVESIQQVGATAEKGYLIDRLVELNHDIYTVELEKRYVVVALQRRPLLQSELKLASDSLGSKIENLR